MLDQNISNTIGGGMWNCHRCGKPTNSMLGGLPTCMWCSADLHQKSAEIDTSTFKIMPGYLEPTSVLIKVKYLVEGLTPLEYIGEGVSDWVDLRLAEDVRLIKHQFALLPLGVAIELPRGYEAIMAPRSSTFKTWGILETNSIGIIDESYCGDSDMWRFAALATRDVEIPKDTRICQFRIIEHQPKLIFQTVEHLGNPNREGFGSTGHK